MPKKYNIVFIAGANYSADIHGNAKQGSNLGWNYTSFWKYNLEHHPQVNLTHWYPMSSWRNMPTDNVDLYFFFDFRPDLWALADYDKFHPRILYWGDAFHALYSVVAQIPLVFDKVYLSEFVEAQHLKLCGFNNVEWLPGAFCPHHHFPLNVNKDIDVGFVGQLDNTVVRNKTTRRRMMDHLSTKFKVVVNQNIRGPGVNVLFNQSKILIERTIFCNMGSRLFDTVGGGGFGLVNKYPCYNGLDQLGMDGTHFVTYDESVEDAEHKVQYYLTHDAEREHIAKTGHEYFLKHHTYANRIDKILSDLR